MLYALNADALHGVRAHAANQATQVQASTSTGSSSGAGASSKAPRAIAPATLITEVLIEASRRLEVCMCWQKARRILDAIYKHSIHAGCNKFRLDVLDEVKRLSVLSHLQRRNLKADFILPKI